MDLLVSNRLAIHLFIAVLVAVVLKSSKESELSQKKILELVYNHFF